MRDDDVVTLGPPRTKPSVGKIRIGLSGWSYKHWRNRFYPPGLPASKELEFVAARFNTVEINRTFYSLVKPAWFRRLRDQTPSDFQFAVKGSRFITHMKKLSGVEVALANFFASGLLELGDKLGPHPLAAPCQSSPRSRSPRGVLRAPAQIPPSNGRLRFYAYS